jgi:hypothetical protein
MLLYLKTQIFDICTSSGSRIRIQIWIRVETGRGGRVLEEDNRGELTERGINGEVNRGAITERGINGEGD